MRTISRFNARKNFFQWLLILMVFMNSFFSQAEDFLIKNATVHTASQLGVIKQADIYVSDGFIMQLGKNLRIKNKHTLIDGKGKHVTPGLINASTQIGLVEIDSAKSTVDYSTKNTTQGASFSIAPAINFRSTLIPQNRINGLTRALVRPIGDNSVFHGQGSVIALFSDQQGLIVDRVAQYASYGIAGADIAGGSRASAYAVLEQALKEADYLRHNRAEYKLGYDWHFSQSIQDLDALKPVLEKKMPLVVSAHRSDDILKIITLAKKYGVRLIITGASEAWLVANEIARAKIPIIIDPIMNLPQSFESLSIRLDAAAILNEAGVKLVFTGADWQSTHNGYLVRQSAGNAVAYGMPAEEALKAMTINTAEVFGIKNYGKIEVGMDADLVIWDADPLELTTSAEIVFIKGQKQPMVSRATRLRDRYWDLERISSKAFTR